MESKLRDEDDEMDEIHYWKQDGLLVLDSAWRRTAYQFDHKNHIMVCSSEE